MKVGDEVWYRGKFATEYSIRGVIEDIQDAPKGDDRPIALQFGVRLENGNFIWAAEDQIRPR